MILPGSDTLTTDNDTKLQIFNNFPPENPIEVV